MSRFSPGFAIFQGGGAKGTALAGALEVAETEFGCDFSLGVAGTSAGSIVAALYAARWSPTEILEELIELDLNTFLDGYDLDCIKLARTQSETLYKAIASNNLANNFSAPFRTRAEVVKLLSHLRKTHGIFSGDQIVKWLRDRLRRHLSVKTVKFADLITPLKIVAADVTSGTVRVFSQVSTPGYSVAEAVRASISIPFFFRPHRVSSHIFNTNEVETTLVLVDGGLVSNFPAWVFDDEAKRLPNITYPVVGFRLLGDGAPLDTSTLLSYARAVYEVGVGAPPYLEKRGVRNLIEVSIRTPGVGTFDFGIDDEPDEQTALNAQNCKG